MITPLCPLLQFPPCTRSHTHRSVANLKATLQKLRGKQGDEKGDTEANVNSNNGAELEGAMQTNGATLEDANERLSKTAASLSTGDKVEETSVSSPEGDNETSATQDVSKGDDDGETVRSLVFDCARIHDELDCVFRCGL